MLTFISKLDFCMSYGIGGHGSLKSSVLVLLNVVMYFHIYNALIMIPKTCDIHWLPALWIPEPFTWHAYFTCLFAVGIIASHSPSSALTANTSNILAPLTCVFSNRCLKWLLKLYLIDSSWTRFYLNNENRHSRIINLTG